LTKKLGSAYLVFTLLAVLALTSQQSFSQEITPEILVLIVYPDGFVFVDYTFLVDPTFPTLNITVFGQVLEDLIVVDANGLPLGYSLNGSTLNVYSLGNEEISVTYLTQDLTSKEGRYWTLAMVTPINTRIILPVETVIISLNKVPEMIETSNDKVTLLMNAGLTEVTYVIGVVGTQEHAQIVLNEAETTIMAIKNLGIILTEAETKLQEAEDAFGLGNYAEAETLGNEAKNLAIQLNQTATQTMSQIAEAENAIASAQNEEGSGLTDAQDLLDQAKSAYNVGNYSEALTLAAQAIAKAEESAVYLSEAFPITEVFGAITILAVVVVGFFFVKSRKNPKEAETKQKKRQIDIERIFREHKDLMLEEKQAIQFLVANNGEAFEAELYDYVKLPRTTTWRLVKRLKRMEIITKPNTTSKNRSHLKTVCIVLKLSFRGFPWIS